MADDTGTDWLTLADRLDELATDRRWDCWNKHGDGSLDVPEGYDPSPDCCDAADGANALRAAADGLRQYAAITAAIGDPDELNRLAKIMRGIGATLWAEHIGRIAVAASLTPTLTPRRFTCIYCNTPINGRIDGCWHDDNGREACPGESPTTFHEAHPA